MRVRSMLRYVLWAWLCAAMLAGCGRTGLADTPPAVTVPPVPTAGNYPPPQVTAAYPAGVPTPMIDTYPFPVATVAPTAVPTVIMPAEPAADFAFSLAYGWCNPDVASTFNHSFTRNQLATPVTSVPLQLSAGEMATIYHKMAEINFFSYPAEFRPLNFNGQYTYNTPTYFYRFVVRNDGHESMVSWQGVEGLQSIPAPEAHRLDELGKLIISIVQAHPEVTRVPPLTSMCI